MVVGYDDEVVIQHEKPGGNPTKGALMIRNSWGIGWGDRVYGWLPYDYVLKSLAIGWWSLVKSEWVNMGKFGLKREATDNPCPSWFIPDPHFTLCQSKWTIF